MLRWRWRLETKKVNVIEKGVKRQERIEKLVEVERKKVERRGEERSQDERGEEGKGED